MRWTLPRIRRHNAPNCYVHSVASTGESIMNNTSLIAIDLAKNIFQVCLMDKNHKIQFNKTFNRKTLIEFIIQQPPSTIAMEACYSSHYWGRLFNSFGHEVKLLPAQHVKPFVRGNKNDHNDAIAIAEASQRPDIKSVPVKTLVQQDIQCLHRLRERYVSQRTYLSNQTRGLLSEYGIVFNQGFKYLTMTLVELISPEDKRLSEVIKNELCHVYTDFIQVSKRLDDLNKSLMQIAHKHIQCQRLMSIPGIGVINATALYSAIGDGDQFKNARELSVWLGITPKQFSSGDKNRMSGITKRGDRYLRKQLIHGARSVIYRYKNRDDKLSNWVNNLVQRRGPNKACVALANKMARLCWILLQRKEMYIAQ